MMMLNCLIVDDEPLARKQTQSYVERIPFLKVVGTARNVAIASEILKAKPVDIIFLDIQMPQQSGIEFLKANDIFQQVIIISAFPEYALEGFELEVTDYLVKPVSFERFTKACNKALARAEGIGNIRSVAHKKDFLYVKVNQRFEKIFIDEILFVESLLNYVRIITDKNRFIVYSSLKAVQDSLPTNSFLKIHKSYLVSTKHIQTIENNQLKIGDSILPISRKNKNVVIQLINGFVLKNL
jgi:DNA-binding LytR/AlgR family response regulator